KTFNITSLFSKDHPLFTRAIEDFKNRVEPLFEFSNPLKIGITSDSFVVGEKYFSGGPLYVDLAKMLHLRRLKSIEIRQGVTVPELTFLFTTLSMHPKEIASAGGIAQILDRQKPQHISVEELDYSQLLKGSGEECKDVWVYLLREAVEKNEPAKADALADNFYKMVQHFRTKELIGNNESRENIRKFLSYLKEKDMDRFKQCTKDMAKFILKEKDVPVATDADMDNIKEFFKDLNDSDFADILSENILTEEGFNSLNFGLFSKILDDEKHSSVAAKTMNILAVKPSKDNRKIKNNIEKLFSESGISTVSDVYRRTLSAFLKETQVSSAVSAGFERESARHNYRFILLNLLYDEKDPRKISAILERLMAQLSEVINKRDLEYLVFIMETVKKKKQEDPSMRSLFEGVDEVIYNFVETNLTDQEPVEDMQYFLNNMHKSSLGIDFYLDRIFDENRFNPGLLKLFFRFFPESLYVFFANLERKSHDMKFLEDIVEILGEVGGPQALGSLKHIYSFANNFIKVEALKAMQKLKLRDSEFLLSVLKSGEISLKKEALIALMKDDEAKEKALETLFCIKSPWGTKDSLILENIIVVEEVGLKAAQKYLEAIAKRRFFWNASIRKEALKVLKKWGY
ncbi:MAG: hypothetical protein ACM3IL_02255, partial [Deltaproteobacteria bacterium]